ncbi:MAG: FlgD immunoglobulin-like domain containing protein [Phycisphaerae bacterium]|nr:FlgD immunoglobulin-like domain containing protein [Phycisphaerae bacterium]
MDRLYFLLPAVLAAILLGGRGFVSCALAADKPAPGQAIEFEFSLTEAAKTSAGVFDADGRLVRALWAIENLKAGKHKKTWDGLDDFGKEAPAGEYQFRVVLNGATYRTVGAIGNSGKPPSAAGHTPVNMLSLVVDDEGGIYTANMWDEAGADFKKWNPEGESVFDSHYGVRNGKPYGLPYAITVDDKYIFVSVHGMARGLSVAHQQIRRFNRSDGKLAKFPKVPRDDGHIAIYDWPRKMTPNPSTPGEATYRSNPLRSLAIVGDTLLVADAVGRILKYDKETGEPRGEFRVEAPRALAVDKKGQIWIGHKRNLVSVYDLEGKLLRKAISNIGEVASLAFGPKRLLYVADSGAGKVKVFDISGAAPKQVRTLGQKAKPGDRAPDRFYHLRGVAVDPKGNIVTIQTEPPGRTLHTDALSGARLARWTPEGKLIWEQFGLEFVSLGNYGTHEPDIFYSMSFRRYRLLDKDAGTWEYLGNTMPGGYEKFYKVSYWVHGVPRIIELGGTTFVFFATGDGVQVYRMGKQAFELAAMLGGSHPSPDGGGSKGGRGQWTWNNAKGTPLPRPEDVNWFRKPGKGKYQCMGMDIDKDGNIWFGNLSTSSIWQIPIGPFDARGNPTYDWAKAREVVPRDKSELGFRPNMAQCAPDGSVYAFGWSKAWPYPPGNPFWMGGTTLARFDKSGKRLWAVHLPAVVVGLDVIPGPDGGCMVGGGRSATIYHYSADGLLINTMTPGEAMNKETGWLDNHASVAISRDPRDKMLDVFVEDDHVCRIGWYRVDDRNITTISGSLKKTASPPAGD